MRQIDLFAEVLHSYSATANGTLTNAALYEQVANRAGIDPEEFAARVPVGSSGQPHSLLKRQARWHQQSLKKAGVLERVDGERGVWRLTNPASADLNQIQSGVSVVGFSTRLGVAILGSCDTVFSRFDSPIVLCLTSPPYALSKPRAYGNVSEHEMVDWIVRMLEPVCRSLVAGGSICLNISNDIFLSGLPARSMYRERLMLALHDKLGLFKVDELIWVNKAKPPGPIQWASKERVQLNVAYEPIYWLTNDPTKLRSDNRRVLQEHTERHLRLIHAGGEQRDAEYSDGAYSVKTGNFGTLTEGRIPRNVLEFGHACADQRLYKQRARALGLRVHGAPMPLKLASFLVEFMSKPGDLVVDPFGGSFSTAKAAELLGRRWMSTEIMLEYVLGAATRFEGAEGFRLPLVA